MVFQMRLGNFNKKKVSDAYGCMRMPGQDFVYPLTQTREFVPSGHMRFTQRRINVDAALWRCIDVNATLYKLHVPAG